MKHKDFMAATAAQQHLLAEQERGHLQSLAGMELQAAPDHYRELVAEVMRRDETIIALLIAMLGDKKE